jgi:hypothetical protein
VSAPVDDEALFAAIVEEAGVSTGDLEHHDAFIDAYGKKWERRESPPLSEHHRVLLIFDDGEDVFVYAVPKGPAPPPDGFRRFVLQRSPHTGGPSCLITSMGAAVFVRRAADDLAAAFEDSHEGADSRADNEAMRTALTAFAAGGVADVAGVASACLKRLTIQEEEEEQET